MKNMMYLSNRYSLGFVLSVASPWILLVVSFALGTFSVFQFPLNHDASWILYMAEHIWGGARLYIDFPEINPPLIVWLSIPVSIAAKLANVPVDDLFRVLVLALAAISISLSALILRRKLGTTVEWALLLIACYVAVTLPGYDFGQREHLAILLVMPYLAEAILRAKSDNTRRYLHVIVAVFAAFGFGLKPHFLLVPLLVESLIILQTRRRPSPGVYVIAGVISIYLVVILLFAPAYIPLVKILSRAYWNYSSTNWFDFLSVPNCLIAAILAAFAWLVRPSPRAALNVVSAAALGFAAAAFIQHKAWSYHWYPAAALCWLLFGLAAATVVSRRRTIGVQIAPLIIGVLVASLSATAFIAAPYKAQAENPYPMLLEPVIKELGGGPVMIFSTALRVSFPLVTRPGIGTSSRFPSMGLLPAAFNINDMEIEKYVRKAFAEDMRKTPPHLIIIQTNPYGLPPSFDYLEYFSRDPALARELKLFRPAKSIGEFRIFQKVHP